MYNLAITNNDKMIILLVFFIEIGSVRVSIIIVTELGHQTGEIIQNCNSYKVFNGTQYMSLRLV